MDVTIINTKTSISNLIDKLNASPTIPPSLYIDIEGINLSRSGSISLIQIYNHPSKHTYLIDIHVLRHLAFTTPGKKRRKKTLKTILESPIVPKVFFDVRNDSDALYSHYGISLQGVIDIQLMELASRTYPRSKQFLNGLQYCIEQHASITPSERKTWSTMKENGKRLFAPEKGGNFEVFNERPLREQIVEYCVQDVVLLPDLYEVYAGKLTRMWKTKVEIETLRRVKESQGVGYQANGDDKRLGPWA